LSEGKIKREIWMGIFESDKNIISKSLSFYVLSYKPKRINKTTEKGTKS